MAAKMENVVIHTALTVSRWYFMHFNFKIYLRNVPYDIGYVVLVVGTSTRKDDLSTF